MSTETSEDAAMKRNVNIMVRITEAEAEALRSHPSYREGKLADLVRQLALEAVGLAAPDPYAEHKARPRDKYGRVASPIPAHKFVVVSVPQAAWQPLVVVSRHRKEAVAIRAAREALREAWALAEDGSLRKWDSESSRWAAVDEPRLSAKDFL